MSKFLHNVKPVYVEWIDSMGSGGWGIYKPGDMRCVSVGHLVQKTKDRVVIALSRSAHTDGDHMEIPMFAVKKIRRLKL